MCLKVFRLFFLVAISRVISVNSQNVSLKIVTMDTKKEIGLVVESNGVKEQFANSALDILIMEGKVSVLYVNSIADISSVEKLILYQNATEDLRPAIDEIMARNLTSIKDVTFKLNSTKEDQKISCLKHSTIKTLILNYNLLNTLPKNILKKIPNLKSLDLRGNKTEHLQQLISLGIPIENLDLSSNFITTILPNLLQNLTNLIKVVIINNQLTRVCSGVFSNHQALQKINLWLNKISHIDSDAFDNMPQLTSVNLADNKLRKIDTRWFHNSPNVYYLNFALNHIEDIPPEAFKNIQNDEFKTIKLRENKIENISCNAFKGLRKIHVLDFKDNLIEKWNACYLGDVETVNTLDLYYNRIKCPEGNFDKVFKPDVVNLVYNPLDSDCLERINEWKKQPAANGHIVCTNPKCYFSLTYLTR